jgi:hypothetical protein
LEHAFYNVVPMYDTERRMTWAALVKLGEVCLFPWYPFSLLSAQFAAV